MPYTNGIPFAILLTIFLGLLLSFIEWKSQWQYIAAVIGSIASISILAFAIALFR
jgi:hypothetical protein